MATDPTRPRAGWPAHEEDPLWYKDAIIYQLHVRSFSDSNGDGIGDFRGLRDRLDYLYDLGVSAIWLLPFYPSPLKDDGYDIADYTNIHPSYGSLRDFQAFLREAHRRGLRVITELVLNHTSDQHPWFQRARRAPPGSRWRDFYVWSDTPERYRSARIIFKDFETSNWAWDPVANAHYWHRFYTHQPDLNFDNPEMRRALLQTVDLWLGMGVDGLRLDAVPYLYEREGTSSENLPETHAFLKELRAHVDERFAHRMLLAEANQWPEDAGAYFGEGDECHMNFHFPLMPRLFMAVHMEDRFPIIDILEQTPAIPENCQWAVFLRNHDELTLEMVTDEDRDYMYRVYAQDAQARINLGIRRRLAPLLGNNRRRLELMNGLLFSLPGAPIVYYGDEIGMGDNIYLGDRNGVRTPMQWSGDRNAGFSRANPHKLYLPVNLDPEYHYETVNVEAQQNNPHSLFWWMKRLIALRKRYKAFARGSIEFLYPENRKVLAFIRRYQDETILVIANLSRFVQYAELDMAAYQGMTPLELFGRTEFPSIGELPYFITLGPHSFFWFSLEGRRAHPEGAPRAPEEARLPLLTLAGAWSEVFHGRAQTAFEAALPGYLGRQRWFGGKSRSIQSVSIIESIPTAEAGGELDARILLVKVSYVQGEPENYLLAVATASGQRAERVLNELPDSVLARLRLVLPGKDEETGVLYEALADKSFMSSLLQAIGRRRRFRGTAGELAAAATPALRELGGVGGDANLEPAVLRADQSNTSIVYGDRYILKLFRRPHPGLNPDLEIGRLLTGSAAPVQTPPVAGFLEYRRGRGEPMTLGILHAYVPNEGDAWRYTLDTVVTYLERVLTEMSGMEPAAIPLPTEPLTELAERELPALAQDLIGPYIQWAELLGRRTGEMHVALASATEDPAFAPEPFTPFYQRSLYQSMRSLLARVYPLLRSRLPQLPEDVRAKAEKVLSCEQTAQQRFRAVTEKRIGGMRIRCHGDYHLGQVLFTGKDFVIIDFEGEPARPLSERRLKRPPLKDVAGMLRSFHYAAYAGLQNLVALGVVQPERMPAMERWVRFWYRWVSALFLRSYLRVAGQLPALPPARDELQTLLDALILEKAVYEVGYELDSRPDWVGIPLNGILQELEDRDEPATE
ncbi:MAG: maltose alpha-D-glucosyltransferase [Dehalococcoidia bacterium]|nr:maltose alpha-D-glucosyltransferase [Dehalococcoidia bacterium]